MFGYSQRGSPGLRLPNLLTWLGLLGGVIVLVHRIASCRSVQLSQELADSRHSCWLEFINLADFYRYAHPACEESDRFCQHHVMVGIHQTSLTCPWVNDEGALQQMVSSFGDFCIDPWVHVLQDQVLGRVGEFALEREIRLLDLVVHWTIARTHVCGRIGSCFQFGAVNHDILPFGHTCHGRSTPLSPQRVRGIWCEASQININT